MAEVPASPFFIIFSDLDGTLLDNDTYGWKDSEPALDLCRRLCFPVILVSSKTRAEMEKIVRELSISAPFISENGGGIFWPSKTREKPPTGVCLDQGLWRLSLGSSYTHLTESLREIRDELGWRIRGFSDMTVEEISRLTGLDIERSRLAAKREYDEPFIVSGLDPGDRERLSEVASNRGLTVTEGGRFFHLHGSNDKGRAMEILVLWYIHSHEHALSIALGDSPNDFPMLERADYPVLVRSQREFPMLKKKIPRLMITNLMGPKGWNAAILELLGGKEEAGDVRKFSK